MGSFSGAIKSAAHKAGLTEKNYRLKLIRGLKRCWRCQSWQSLNNFKRDATRGDGLYPACASCRNAWVRSRYRPRPRPKPGRRFVPARENDKRQARRRVNHLVSVGLIPKPGDVSCVDCGHHGTTRKHEYDHYLGYAAQHQEKVQGVCVPCHHSRSKERGECRKKQK